MSPVNGPRSRALCPTACRPAPLRMFSGCPSPDSFLHLSAVRRTDTYRQFHEPLMETQSHLLPGSPLVDIEDLSLFLPGDARQKMILHHIDWHLCRGEHHLLLGHNGAGKTTLMRLMHGLLWPAEGRIVWHTSEGAETSPIAGRAVSALVSPDQQENYQRQRWYITGRELLLTAFEDTPLLYTNTSEQRHAQVEDMARRLRALDLLVTSNLSNRLRTL